MAPKKSKKSKSEENRRVASLVRELTTLGNHEKAIRLCEERGWEPSKVDPRLWQPQLDRALGDIYPWLWEAAGEPLDFDRLSSCLILQRHGILTHGQLAEKSFSDLKVLRGLGNAKLSALERYLKEHSGSFAPVLPASGQEKGTAALSSSTEESLELILGKALERLVHRQTFALRHLRNPPMNFREIGAAEGVTHQGARNRIKRDESRLEAFMDMNTVRAAVEDFQQEIGPLCPTDDDRLEGWRQQLDPEPFELLRWFAGYTYRGTDLENEEELKAALSLFDEITQDRWLVHEDELLSSNQERGLTPIAARVAIRQSGWRDIGEGWHVCWEGTLGDKAERVLRLLGKPTGISELLGCIGEGAEGTLRNYVSESEVLIRTDNSFTVALEEWGLEEYEGIPTEIAQRIERGGGVASRSAIIKEFTTDFGVKEQSVIAYLSTEMFATTGDEVRLADPAQVRPGDPREVEEALFSNEGWGQIVEVTSDHLQGYSILLDRRVCYPNGIRPNDQLEVEVVGFPEAVASVIWRTTAVGKRVEVGRLSTLLNEASVSVGSRILVVPSTNGVYLFIGDEAIRNAAQRSDQGPTEGKFEVRKSPLAAKFGKPQRL